MHNGRGQTVFTDKGRAAGHHIPKAVSLTLHPTLAGTWAELELHIDR
jgi:hypothetical protein